MWHCSDDVSTKTRAGARANLALGPAQVAGSHLELGPGLLAGNISLFSSPPSLGLSSLLELLLWVGEGLRLTFPFSTWKLASLIGQQHLKTAKLLRMRSASSENSIYIPEEILIHILLRLPAKSLARFIALKANPKFAISIFFNETFKARCLDTGGLRLHGSSTGLLCLSSNSPDLNSTHYIEVEVYSLSTHSWKSIGALPTWIISMDWSFGHAVSNGVAYWIMRAEKDYSFHLVSLDTGSEVFEKVLLPEATWESLNVDISNDIHVGV
ncbi:hypothetical protein L3X38_003742 [Prunus dulcis]|uniref:F-box associated beta-propeller type 1 domain-containing protein n=1 Tax=Prunus dulcis TaxID=3755 RepID=A0AAD5F2D4_PRUDU|nr:hypothetical protein L3X38_003742 [Prunus dulcis]